MPSARTALKLFLVVLFSFLLWADLLLLSVLFPAQSVALDKNVWLSVLEKIDAYEAFVPFGAQMLEQGFSSGGSIAIPSAALGPLIRQSFSKEWLNAELNKVVSNFFDFISGKTEEIDLSLSMLEPKQKILQSVRENGVGPVLLPVVEEAVQQLPDRYELVPATEARGFLMQQRALVSIVHQAVLLLFIMALVFAIIIAALLRNQSALLAFGIVFLLAGLLVLLVSQAMASSVPRIASELQFELQTQFHSSSSFNFEPALTAFFNPLGSQLGLFGIVETVFGIAGIGSYWFLRQQKGKKPASG